MKKIFENSLFINTLNFIILLCMFIFLLIRMKYIYIQNDDICDLVCPGLSFYHGRFFTELFSKFTVFYLPDLLKVDVQDFAIYSEAAVKILLFLSLIYCVSVSYFQFKNKDIKLPVLVLEDDSYKGKIYTIREHPRYFVYLHTVYNVNVNQGIEFKPDKEALKEFFDNGGILTEEELKNLNFSNIKVENSKDIL